jgi:hypothetical protein
MIESIISFGGHMEYRITRNVVSEIYRIEHRLHHDMPWVAGREFSTIIDAAEYKQMMCRQNRSKNAEWVEVNPAIIDESLNRFYRLT